MGSSKWDKVLQNDAVRNSSETRHKKEIAVDDGRPLYERLQEQRAKRQADYLETLKLANRAAVLLDEDVAYLESLERHKREEELLRLQEEEADVEAFRKRKKFRTVDPSPPRLNSVASGESDPKNSILRASSAEEETKSAGSIPTVGKKREILGIKPKRKI